MSPSRVVRRKPSSKNQLSVCKFQQGRRMGAEFSAFNQANRSTKTSRVLTFHSSTEWRNYFESKKKTSKLIVIDFKASWCQPCQFMEPIFNNLSAQYKEVEFVQIDVDELMTVAQELGVEAIPTFILFKEGKEVAKIVGPNKEELQLKIREHKGSQDSGS